MDRELLDQACAAWRTLADAPDALRETGSCRVIARTENRFSPAGWIGIVRIGDAVVIEAPKEHCAALAAAFPTFDPTHDPTEPETLRAALGEPRHQLGPAVLAYADAGFAAVATEPPGAHELSDPVVQAVLDAATPSEVAESGIGSVTSPIFVATHGGAAAVSGYQRWPGGIAHVGILTDPAVRGRGLAKIAARLAISHAMAEGLLAQWRAALANRVSRGLAQSLGLIEVGRQLSERRAPVGAD